MKPTLGELHQNIYIVFLQCYIPFSKRKVMVIMFYMVQQAASIVKSSAAASSSLQSKQSPSSMKDAVKSFFGLDDESDDYELLSKNLNDDIVIDPDFIMSTDVYEEDEQLLVQSANKALCAFFKMNNDEDAKLLF
eukprot:7414278-Ditylum_brightwellii.AAC.1